MPSKKDPVRGMQPMDEYSKTDDLKDIGLPALGIAGMAGLAKMTINAAEKKRAERDAEISKQEAKKSSRETDVENARKDAKVKKEYESYEKEKAKGMKKGGSASSRADGCAMRGKTRGKMV